MQPNQPQYSIDYLNQIAPEPKKPGLSNKLFFLVLGGGLIVAIIVFSMMLHGGGSASTNTRLETLTARLATLQTISQTASSNITDNQLEATNSNLNLALTNANTAIVTPLANNHIDAKNLPKNILAQEDGSQLTAKLADAKLNAVYDRTYAREMHLQVSTVLILMSEIYNTTNSKSLREFLTTTTTNLTPIDKQLSSFKDANS